VIKIGTCPQSKLTPKDEGIDNWFNFLYIGIFWIFLFFYTLDAGITFSKQVFALLNQGGLHNIDLLKYCNLGFAFGI